MKKYEGTMKKKYEEEIWRKNEEIWRKYEEVCGKYEEIICGGLCDLEKVRALPPEGSGT